jgi:gluconolactonase
MVTSLLLLLLAQASPTPAPPVSAPLPATPLLATGARWEKVVPDLKFGEGPAWHPSGYLLFEDGPRNRTMKLGADGKVSVFREPTGGANGLGWDPQGRLVICEGIVGDAGEGGRRIVRMEKDGKLTVLAERFEGKKLNSPNDVTIDHKGRIYFTDARYSKHETMELDKESVYRIDPDGKLTRIIDTVKRPNGILVTRDARTLYVADNASPGGVVTLMGYDLDASGNARNERVLYDFQTGRGIDGMALDTAGRIWATAGTKEKAGMYVFKPDARRATVALEVFIPMPEDPTNATFAGPKRDVLYVTTTRSLFKIQTKVKGQPSPPGK